MGVDQTWTDPSTGGAIDLGTDDILPEVVWDKVLSNLKRLGGTAGPPNVQATRGAFPVSGYVMGATGHDRHVEGGTVNVTTNNRAGYTDVTFANAFASAPYVVACAVGAPLPDGFDCRNTSGSGAPGPTGFRLVDNTDGTGVVHTFHWIALGSDV